ncbi:hypothetical protein MHYP_G00260670 [Metynnis hypsauchen]
MERTPTELQLGWPAGSEEEEAVNPAGAEIVYLQLTHSQVNIMGKGQCGGGFQLGFSFHRSPRGHPEGYQRPPRGGLSHREPP